MRAGAGPGKLWCDDLFKRHAPPHPSSSPGLAQVGYIRLGHFKIQNSGKPEFWCDPVTTTFSMILNGQLNFMRLLDAPPSRGMTHWLWLQSQARGTTEAA
jgi:hypothetical protein